MDAKQSAVVSCNVAEMLNAFGPENSKAFIQKMSVEHRSLQQRFTALCVMWLRDQATKFNTGCYDDRNRASCELAAHIINNTTERQLTLPFI